MLCIGIATAARVVTKDERQPHGKSIEMDKVQFFIVWEKKIRVFGKVKEHNDQLKRLSAASSKLHSVWGDMAVTATS